MNLEPRNLGIALHRRSRFVLWLGVGVAATVAVAYVLDPAFGKAVLATVLLVLPALAIGGLVPLRRGQSFGLQSVGAALLAALVVGYLLVAKRWLLPWLLSALG